mmetsp:Transcript_31043/g.81475  ORF Transcript_31043/g.81475 Transcript_31043/m.81475 type:complete len:189 (-) Transcript_31043:365-931(-)
MSRSTVNMLGVSIGFFDEEANDGEGGWTTFPVALVECRNGEKGEDLLPLLEKVVETYGIQHKALTLVKDGGGNLQKAGRLLKKAARGRKMTKEITMLPCIMHAVNLRQPFLHDSRVRFFKPNMLLNIFCLQTMKETVSTMTVNEETKERLRQLFFNVALTRSTQIGFHQTKRFTRRSISILEWTWKRP